MTTTAPLVEKIVSQVHETPDDTVVSALQQSVRREKNEVLRKQVVSPDVQFARSRFARTESRFARSMKSFRPKYEVVSPED